MKLKTSVSIAELNAVRASALKVRMNEREFTRLAALWLAREVNELGFLLIGARRVEAIDSLAKERAI